MKKCCALFGAYKSAALCPASLSPSALLRVMLMLVNIDCKLMG